MYITSRTARSKEYDVSPEDHDSTRREDEGGLNPDRLNDVSLGHTSAPKQAKKKKRTFFERLKMK